MQTIDNISLNPLSERQREVMDLLIQYKTSKEIARIIGISHHTVDQHIHFSKIKLGASNRNEAARLYQQLISTWQQTTYDESSYGEIRVAA